MRCNFKESLINSDRIRLTATASDCFAGMRLDQVAAQLFTDFSRARLQKWIRSGELSVDGAQAKPTYRIGGGETLSLDARPERQEEIHSQDIPLDVVFSDQDLIIVNKPAGLVVHPAAGNPDGTLQNALLHYDSSLAVLPRSGIVHRLDKGTSGLLVIARSLRAHSSLVEQLQARQIGRIYEAIVAGDIDRDGSIDAPVGRHPRDRKRMAVVSAGKHAVTHYRILARFGQTTHVEVSLETGRTHQIRVHMAHIGHPLVGDPVYGRRVASRSGMPVDVIAVVRSFPRQALHARRLRLRHPGTKQEMNFEAPLPDDFETLLSVLTDRA